MAGELRFVDDKLLFVDDKLAMSADCCCEEEENDLLTCTDFNNYMAANWTSGLNLSSKSWDMTFPTHAPTGGAPNCGDIPPTYTTTTSAIVGSTYRWGQATTGLSFTVGNCAQWFQQTLLSCSANAIHLTNSMGHRAAGSNSAISWSKSFPMPASTADIFNMEHTLSHVFTGPSICCATTDDVMAEFNG